METVGQIKTPAEGSVNLDHLIGIILTRSIRAATVRSAKKNSCLTKLYLSRKQKIRSTERCQALGQVDRSCAEPQGEKGGPGLWTKVLHRIIPARKQRASVLSI